MTSTQKPIVRDSPKDSEAVEITKKTPRTIRELRELILFIEGIDGQRRHLEDTLRFTQVSFDSDEGLISAEMVEDIDNGHEPAVGSVYNYWGNFEQSTQKMFDSLMTMGDPEVQLSLLNGELNELCKIEKEWLSELEDARRIAKHLGSDRKNNQAMRAWIVGIQSTYFKIRVKIEEIKKRRSAIMPQLRVIDAMERKALRMDALANSLRDRYSNLAIPVLTKNSVRTGPKVIWSPPK